MTENISIKVVAGPPCHCHVKHQKPKLRKGHGDYMLFIPDGYVTMTLCLKDCIFDHSIIDRLFCFFLTVDHTTIYHYWKRTNMKGSDV
jgi:hypothetical protein